MADIKLTIWNEFRHEQKNEAIKKLYPQGMHGAIAEHMRRQPGIAARCATLDEPEHGLTQQVLDDTDVLIWWGHMAHNEVADEIVDHVQQQILVKGMGLIVLHSGHMSKIFRRMMGTTGNLRWREVAEKERLWVVNPAHPITAGLPDYFELPETEMYGEFFDIAPPDELVFISWFEGGEVFRSGATWTRGKGKVFYFRPGHETFGIFYDEHVLKVLENAVRWAKFAGNTAVENTCWNAEPLEPIKK